MNDYLWDGSGEPDPEIEQLETLMRPLRYAPPAELYSVPALIEAERKMNDYLWDGTGEPDPQIERLETAMRPLRYAPPAEPYSLPAFIEAERNRRNPIWYGAIAATVLAALALGAWFVSSRPAETVAIAAASSTGGSDLVWTGPELSVTPPAPEPRRVVIHARPSAQDLARMRAEQREGRIAAEQLLKALQITSDQLNTVRTKIQTNAPSPAS